MRRKAKRSQKEKSRSSISGARYEKRLAEELPVRKPRLNQYRRKNYRTEQRDLFEPHQAQLFPGAKPVRQPRETKDQKQKRLAAQYGRLRPLGSCAAEKRTSAIRRGAILAAGAGGAGNLTKGVKKRRDKCK